jgi:hypothetical protein
LQLLHSRRVALAQQAGRARIEVQVVAAVGGASGGNNGVVRHSFDQPRYRLVDALGAGIRLRDAIGSDFRELKSRELPGHKRQGRAVQIGPKAGNQRRELLRIKQAFFGAAVRLALMPDDARQRARLLRRAGAGQRLVVGVRIGVGEVGAGRPGLDARATDRARNQTNNDARIGRG